VIVARDAAHVEDGVTPEQPLDVPLGLAQHLAIEGAMSRVEVFGEPTMEAVHLAERQANGMVPDTVPGLTSMRSAIGRRSLPTWCAKLEVWGYQLVELPAPGGVSFSRKLDRLVFTQDSTTDTQEGAKAFSTGDQGRPVVLAGVTSTLGRRVSNK
jgi:hypothetical protein